MIKSIRKWLIFLSFKKDVDNIMIKIIKQEMVLVSSSIKRKQVNKYLVYLRDYFEIVYREDKGDRTENGMTVFDSAIPDNYESLKLIPIIDLNLFKGKDITFGLVFRPTIKEIINEK